MIFVQTAQIDTRDLAVCYDDAQIQVARAVIELLPAAVHRDAVGGVGFQLRVGIGGKHLVPCAADANAGIECPGAGRRDPDRAEYGVRSIAHIVANKRQ